VHGRFLKVKYYDIKRLSHKSVFGKRKFSSRLTLSVSINPLAITAGIAIVKPTELIISNMLFIKRFSKWQKGGWKVIDPITETNA